MLLKNKLVCLSFANILLLVQLLCTIQVEHYTETQFKGRDPSIFGKHMTSLKNFPKKNTLAY